MTKQKISANLFCQGAFSVRSSDLDFFGGRVLNVVSHQSYKIVSKDTGAFKVHFIWVTNLQCCTISLQENMLEI